MPVKAKDEKRRSKGIYRRGLRNQKFDLINPCESRLYDCMMISVGRTFENKNHIKIKIARHTFIENGCI